MARQSNQNSPWSCPVCMYCSLYNIIDKSNSLGLILEGRKTLKYCAVALFEPALTFYEARVK